MEKIKRQFTDVLVIVAAILLAGIITGVETFVYIALGLLILVALVNKIAEYISFLWQGLAKILGFFVSKIILGLVFIVFLIPVSIFYKLFSKNRPISNQQKSSYWFNKEDAKIDFNKAW